MDSAKIKMAEQFINLVPHCKALGMKLTLIEDGVAEMALAYDKKLVGDPETGVLHGGAISALMDTCCGTAAMSHPSSPRRHGDHRPADRLHARGDTGAGCDNAGRVLSHHAVRGLCAGDGL